MFADPNDPCRTHDLQALIRAIPSQQVRLIDREPQQLAAAFEVLDDRHTRVVLFGEFSSGKSTLINALLGKVVLPASLIPTTGQATHIFWGDRERVVVHFRNQRSEIRDLGELQELVVLGPMNVARQEIVRIEVQSSAALLQPGLKLIDTPGLADAASQTEVALRELQTADCVVLLLRADRLLGQSERTFAEFIIRELGKPLLPVISFMNLVPDEASRSQIRRRFKQWAGNFRSFEVNALGALQHQLGIANAPAPSDDFDRLVATLRKWAARGEVRDCNRLRCCRRTVEQSRQGNRARLRDLETDHDRLNRSRATKLEILLKMKDKVQRGRRSETAMMRAVAAEKLDAGWKALESKSQACQAGASEVAKIIQSWFDAAWPLALTEAAAACESRLVSFAGPERQRLRPLTLVELVALEKRTAVVVDTALSDNVGGGAVLLGGAIGTWAIPIPVVGTAVGVLAGAVIGSLFEPSQKTILSAHVDAVRSDWQAMTAKVLQLVESETGARMGELAESLEHSLRALEQILPGEEIAARSDLDLRLSEVLTELDRSLELFA